MPTGLGCRDSLRLEMGYALYGNDIDDPDLTARGRPVLARESWGRTRSWGRKPCSRRRRPGLTRRLRGFKLAERGFPRPGYDVVFAGETVGPVRSGTLSPSLGCGIGHGLPARGRQAR